MSKAQKTASGKSFDPKEARARSAAKAAKQTEIYVQGEREATGTFMNVPKNILSGPNPYVFYACLRNYPPHQELINNLLAWGFEEVPREWNAYRVGDKDPGQQMYLMAPLSTKKKYRAHVLAQNKHANRNMSKDFGPHLNEMAGIIGASGDVKIESAIVQG